MSLRAAGAAILALSTLFGAGCGGGDAGPAVSGEPISVQELARSASTTADAASGRFSFEVAATLPGSSERFAMSGEGAFDAASKRARFAVDMSSVAKVLGGFIPGLAGPNAVDLPDFDDPDGWKIELVQDGKVEYVRFPAIDDQLPAGTSWLRGADGISAGAVDFRQFTSGDPREALDALRGIAGEIETMGSEDLRGIETTRYRAILDPAELAKARDREGRSASPSVVERLTRSGVDDIPVHVWIDADGLIKKLTMALSATQPGTTQSSEASISFELWDYGEPVEIAVPPASEVADASALRG
ncbi:MAG TPA: hypothetical protein VJ807_08920 [Gaiellaceae bacterium]|nr:hypothetical protein [Gaiellaceae bacterium]